MTLTIAVAGKGGTGKTTFTGLLIDSLLQEKEAILAVDADPSMNLNEVLGVNIESSIADIREDALKRDSKFSSMPKDRLVEYLLHQTLIESESFDLLAMGRPEGKRCYCFVNNLLRRHLDLLSDQYKYVIIDNEAGMEHLSRMTTRDVDLLVIISDSSQRGLLTAKRIQNLVDELKIPIKQQVLIINKLRKENSEKITQNARKLGFSDILSLPFDEQAIDFDEEGIPLVSLPKNSALKIAIENFAEQIRKEQLLFTEKIEAITQH